MPAGGASSRRRLNRADLQATTCNEPGDHGIRGPHFAEAKLVAAPDESRYSGHEADQAPSGSEIARQTPRALDGFCRVGSDAVGPAPNLVAEEPEPAGRPCSNRPFDDGATGWAVPVSKGCLLDDEASFRDANLEGRVVESRASRPSIRDAIASKMRPLRRAEWPPVPSGNQ